MTIGDVARLTALTKRALRYYEERGLLNPRRSASGRRVYSASDLTRIHHIVLLRRARFSLAQIKALFDGSAFNLGSLIDVQVETLEAERQAINESLGSLYATRLKLLQGDDIDLEMLCELIKLGDKKMNDESWQNIYDRYYTPEEQENWKAAKEKLAESFDQEEYDKRWRDLATRIKRALPLDASSAKAQAFVDQWNVLLEPFTSLADDQMKAGAVRIWNHIDDWSEEADSPISKKVWQFIQEAQACSRNS